MEPTQELIDELFVEKVMAARRRDIGSKIMAGAELFEYGCETMRAGIRMQHPEASTEEVERILRARLEMGRRVEEALYDSA